MDHGFPIFKYHPYPISTGAFQQSDIPPPVRLLR